jgi:hypothetical protein
MFAADEGFRPLVIMIDDFDTGAFLDPDTALQCVG